MVDFVGQVTPLKAAGRSHKGLCPFHREKSPSFHVDRGKGLFYCFGCGAGGDVFKFLMLAERFTFPEAVEHVAARVGIELPRKKRTGDDIEKDSLFQLMEDAAEAYHQALGWTPNVAERYLRERNVDPEIWRRYGFGYAPDSWDYLLTRLGGKHGNKKLEAAGLILPRKSGEGFYDRFRNRLLVPIHSEVGSLIGFGGRSLDGTDPKYLNSPESAIFNKSNLLYNLHRAKEKIRKLERAILVEGYFDCISLDHAGVPGVIASMGTSLTPGQASLLRRYAKRVVIAYDGDEAGRNATLRAAPVLLAAGIMVHVVDVGAGCDPDTYLRDRGLEATMELLGQPQDVFTFAMSRVAARPAELSGTEKTAALEQLAPLLTAVTDPVIRNDAAQRIADHFRLEFETVWAKFRGKGLRALNDPTVRAPISTGETIILRAALNEELPRELALQLREEYFEDATTRAVFRAIAPALSSGQPLDFPAIATDLKSETALAKLSEVALADGAEDGYNAKSLEDIVRRMGRRYLERRLMEIQLETQEAVRDGDTERHRLLNIEKIELSRHIHTLK